MPSQCLAALRYLSFAAILSQGCQDAAKTPSSLTKQMFSNSVRRSPSSEEQRGILRLGNGCTAFLVENNTGKTIVGTARHCVYDKEAEWCATPNSVTDQLGQVGSCKRIVASDPRYDIMLFEADFSGDTSKNFRLAAYHPTINTRLVMQGFPADDVRRGQATLTENCWVLSDVRPSPYSDKADPSQQHNCSTYGGNSGGPIVIEGTRDVVGEPFTYVPGDMNLRPQDALEHSAHFASMADFVARHRDTLMAEGITISARPPKAKDNTILITSPSNDSKINVSTSESPEGEGASNAFDLNPDTKWLVFKSSAWIQYEFPQNRAYSLAGYYLSSANDFSERDPSKWTVYGSNDGVAWTSVDERSEEVYTERKEKRYFTVDDPRAFSRYRFVLKNGERSSSLQLSDIVMFGKPGIPVNPGITASGEMNHVTGRHKAFDGSIETKWLTLEHEAWIEYDARTEVEVRRYAIVSANDAPEGDPNQWEVKASNDRVTWVTLDAQENQEFDQRFQTKFYSLKEVNLYRYYRFELKSKQDPILHLSEIQLFTPDLPL